MWSLDMLTVREVLPLAMVTFQVSMRLEATCTAFRSSFAQMASLSGCVKGICCQPVAHKGFVSTVPLRCYMEYGQLQLCKLPAAEWTRFTG